MLEETLREWWSSAREEGRQEGMQRLLLSLLEQRFGELPSPVRSAVSALRNYADLEALQRRALAAASLDELKLA